MTDTDDLVRRLFDGTLTRGEAQKIANLLEQYATRITELGDDRIEAERAAARSAKRIATLEAENARLRDLDESKCAQAYQVIGALLAEADTFGSDEGQRALDYFCDDVPYDEDFLPWPREST